MYIYANAIKAITWHVDSPDPSSPFNNVTPTRSFRSHIQHVKTIFYKLSTCCVSYDTAEQTGSMQNSIK